MDILPILLPMKDMQKIRFFQELAEVSCYIAEPNLTCYFYCYFVSSSSRVHVQFSLQFSQTTTHPRRTDDFPPSLVAYILVMRGPTPLCIRTPV